MKVSLNWLKELVEIPAGVAALSELLTKAGVEVEGIETRGCTVENVVVAQILESVQHPNADRLSVCKVADGTPEPRQIVCGAKNYKVGDKVPLALPGAVMPGDFKIKVGKLRGVESAGMMCSAEELGLPKGADGLLILPPESVIGTPITALFPAETVLDVEVTPNRPDLLSHLGMAREIATLLQKTLRVPEAIAALAPSPEPATDITLEAPEACPFYTARRVRGVKVGPSPAWLVAKLEAAGVRGINNIVDVTNYVMLELGQPLHAFDLAKLDGGIRVRPAAEGETFLALDGKTYALAPRHLMIADQKKALAIGGVMGGEDSGVTEATTDILLESAYFTPAGIRRTSRELGLSSDASYRYERGIDPAGVLNASARAVALILEVAGGTAEPVTHAAGSAPVVETNVPFRLERLNAVLGTEVAPETVGRILSGFGLKKTAGGWQAPSFRQDLAREIDLIEEVARVIGIEAVPARYATRFTGSTLADRRHDQATEIRHRLAGLGFHEARSLTLVSEKAVALFPMENVLRVRNPLNEEQAILRPSLVPGLLESLARNFRNGPRDLRLFEVGRVFSASGREERTSLALVWTGAAVPASWRDPKPRAADFFDLKGALAALNLPGLTLEPARHPALALTAELRRGKKAVGIAGQLHPGRARGLDATAPILIAEIDLDLFDAASSGGRYVEPPKFPAVTRDIAMLVPSAVTHARIEEALRAADEPLLAGIELFDVFTDPSGQRIPADQKSVAYALTYRSTERTLKAEEAAEAHQRLKERLKAELAVNFRE